MLDSYGAWYEAMVWSMLERRGTDILHLNSRAARIVSCPPTTIGGAKCLVDYFVTWAPDPHRLSAFRPMIRTQRAFDGLLLTSSPRVRGSAVALFFKCWSGHIHNDSYTEFLRVQSQLSDRLTEWKTRNVGVALFVGFVWVTPTRRSE